MFTFSLLHISQAAGVEAYPAFLQTLGDLLNAAQEYAYSLNMIFFTLGGTLFYYLLLKSNRIPRTISIFGLIAAPLALVGTILDLMGVPVPLVMFLPNLPFELTIGLWLLIKGFKESSQNRISKN